MKYAIIAAGEGSRLASEGVSSPKPLVVVNGECLIDRLVRVFAENNAESICVICNEQMKDVAFHIDSLEKDGYKGQRLPLEHIVKSTPSSMHSFYEVSRLVGNSPVVLTTVDTIFSAKEFSSYVSAFEKALEEGYDGLMGVTDYIDDEKPLYVSTDSDNNVTGFHDAYVDGCRYISGGIYGLTAPCVRILEECMCKGVSRMRNFQRALVDGGMKLKAYPFSKVLDVDHASDIAKAEEFLNSSLL